MRGRVGGGDKIERTEGVQKKKKTGGRSHALIHPMEDKVANYKAVRFFSTRPWKVLQPGLFRLHTPQDQEA